MISKIISCQKNGILTVIQLSTPFQNSFDFISSSNALEKDFISVKEINESGSVNELKIINISDKYVFFMDGDILIGAKQNRVLNTSVLLAPHTENIIPVSCVERGRWRRASEKFYKSDYSAPSSLRGNKSRNIRKSLETNAEYYADQNEVWESVSNMIEDKNTSSPTSNLHDVYEQKSDDLDNLLVNFKLSENSNGLAIFINDKLLNIDLFNRADVFSEYFPQLLKGAALDTLNVKKAKIINETESINKTMELLNNWDKLDFITYHSMGVGAEKRFENNEHTGFELNYNEHIIHLTVQS